MPHRTFGSKKKIKLTVALLYNVRHHYPDLADPRTQLEVDFDDLPAIKWMIRHLESCGYSVIPIEANQHAYPKLYKYKNAINLAFNYAEGIFGQDRECQLPAMLEMLQIPYLGSGPLTCALLFNKAKTKEVLLANGIPTPPFQVFVSPKEKRHSNLKYPLLVKPVSQGSSAGITNDSVVHSDRELKYRIESCIDLFKGPAMAESFLSGKEFSIPMIGNPPRFLPAIESKHSKLPKCYSHIDSLEVKWFYEESGEIHFECPAKTSRALLKRLHDICLDAWTVLGIRDWTRIDLRCNEKGVPFFLEANSPAGLAPPESSLSSYLPYSARSAGISYTELLRKLVETALSRYAKP